MDRTCVNNTKCHTDQGERVDVLLRQALTLHRQYEAMTNVKLESYRWSEACIHLHLFVALHSSG